MSEIISIPGDFGAVLKLGPFDRIVAVKFGRRLFAMCMNANALKYQTSGIRFVLAFFVPSDTETELKNNRVIDYTGNFLFLGLEPDKVIGRSCSLSYEETQRGVYGNFSLSLPVAAVMPAQALPVFPGFVRSVGNMQNPANMLGLRLPIKQINLNLLNTIETEDPEGIDPLAWYYPIPFVHIYKKQDGVFLAWVTVVQVDILIAPELLGGYGGELRSDALPGFWAGVYARLTNPLDIYYFDQYAMDNDGPFHAGKTGIAPIIEQDNFLYLADLSCEGFLMYQALYKTAFDWNDPDVQSVRLAEYMQDFSDLNVVFTHKHLIVAQYVAQSGTVSAGARL